MKKHRYIYKGKEISTAKANALVVGTILFIGGMAFGLWAFMCVFASLFSDTPSL